VQIKRRTGFGITQEVSHPFIFAKRKEYPLVRLICTFILVVFLDQCTKIVVQEYMTLHGSIPILGEFLRLTFIKNPGAAFGIMIGNRLFFLAMSILACGVMIYYFIQLPVRETWGRFALTLIFGGAIGNLIDRILYGEVTDFIDVGLNTYRWPIFNIADMAVSIGVILLFIRLSTTNQTIPDESSSTEQEGIVHREDRSA
jgi:signal peptidase II